VRQSSRGRADWMSEAGGASSTSNASPPYTTTLSALLQHFSINRRPSQTHLVHVGVVVKEPPVLHRLAGAVGVQRLKELLDAGQRLGAEKALGRGVKT
jgi:hypothetical protein